jgi:hypothetical protein
MIFNRLPKKFLALLFLLVFVISCDSPQSMVPRFQKALADNDYASYSELFFRSTWNAGDHFASEKGFQTLKKILEGLRLRGAKPVLISPKEDWRIQIYRVDLGASLSSNSKAWVKFGEVYVLKIKSSKGLADGGSEGSFIEKILLSEKACNELKGKAFCDSLVVPPYNVIE